MVILSNIINDNTYCGPCTLYQQQIDNYLLHNTHISHGFYIRTTLFCMHSVGACITNGKIEIN